MAIQLSHLKVSRNLLIRATPEKVSEEFERFAAWFRRAHTFEKFEPRIGARVKLSIEMDGGPIVVLEPARAITWENNWEEANLQGYEEGWDVKHLSAL